MEAMAMPESNVHPVAPAPRASKRSTSDRNASDRNASDRNASHGDSTTSVPARGSALRESQAASSEQTVGSSALASPNVPKADQHRKSRARYEPAGYTRAEVDQHWKNFHANPGDDTRNALVEVYQGFAGSVTRRFAVRLPRSVDRGDLITAGNVGLMNAVVGFDPERGVRFESYCELRVKGALLDELRTQDWLPRPWRQRMEQQKRSIEALRGREGREPTDEEVAVEMDLSVDLYQKLFGVGLPGTPTGSGGNTGSDDDVMHSLEVVQDTNVADPGDGLTREELLSLVTQRLSPQEYRILYLRYWDGLAMREIGELTDLSESRVCKIHTRLIERLQERLHANPDEE